MDNLRLMITDDMREHFLYRTRAHLYLVRKWSDIIAEAFKSDQRINEYLLNKERDEHDQTKFVDPEYTPYVLITWKYYCKRKGIPFNSTPELDEAMHVATYHHVKHNKHHPEYWDDATTIDNALSRDNRDGVPPRQIDGTKMPLTYIAAKCADWCAMAEELGTNTPQSWARKNINVRWKFTDEQVILIYDILHKVWPFKHDCYTMDELRAMGCPYDLLMQYVTFNCIDVDKLYSRGKK